MYTDQMNRVDRRKQEVRERILTAAYDLFLERGVTAATLEDICERTDVANRTFFNHFPTRQDMMRALSERRLTELREVIFDGSTEPTPTHLIALFDRIAAQMVEFGDKYREVVGAMVNATGYGLPRGSSLHTSFLELIKNGVARGDVLAEDDPQILADVIVGSLSGAIVNWATDHTYSLTSNMHDLAVVLARTLSAPSQRRIKPRKTNRR
jgi:AcrR family transcriptional regulator